MCRLAAYLGASVAIEQLVTSPENSLVKQSMEAQEAKLSVNGDGFGLAWYNRCVEPGLFKQATPAWSDLNLLSLSRQISARCILAHVRAATVGALEQSNCHPFTFGRWSFMHNGQIGGYQGLRRSFEAQLSDGLYAERLGSTDSELLFLLLLENGLERDPVSALKAVVELVERGRAEQRVKQAFRMSVVLSDGERLIAARYSSDERAPSLYWSDNFLGSGFTFSSEPMDAKTSRWVEVPTRTVAVFDASLHIEPFARPGWSGR